MHYQEIADLLDQQGQPIKIRYTELYRILCAVLHEATAESRMDFSGPFARLTYLAMQRQWSVSLRIRLNELRARCQAIDDYDEDELQKALPSDVLSVVMLLEVLNAQQAPLSLLNRLPSKQAFPFLPKIHPKDHLRVCVTDFDSEYITAVYEVSTSESPDSHETLRICYADPENRMGNWAYLKALLSVGCQLNLVKCQMKEGVCYPELIILEPDYLVDVSRLSRCFTECGASAYNHLLNLLQPQPYSYSILMGNMAGMLLDEELGRRAEDAVNYAECARSFMQHYALEILASKENFAPFHEEAKAQQQNIRNALHTLLTEEKAFQKEKTLLEPSFFCEQLGLQGRMDLMQDDLAVLLEQKGGKRQFATNAHRESHYVQMLLYQAILHYSFHRKNEQISSFLLYSKFDDGLIKEGPAPKLLFEAFKVRNQMVWLQFYLAKEGTTILEKIQPEHLNTLKRNNRLWNDYMRPKIALTLDTFRMNDKLAKAYVNRMLTFVAREHLLAKIGTPGREASGLSAMWNSSLQEKIVAGSIFYNLKATPLETQKEKAEELLFLCDTLRNTKENPSLYLPNFRVGDTVLLYRYQAAITPDVRKSIVFRANLLEIQPHLVRLRLRNPQHNINFFAPHSQYRWAIEKDSTESNFAMLYRSVYTLLTTTPERRQLLLGQRPPKLNTELELNGDYSLQGKAPHFNRLVLQAKQAQDYFLLIGPPGTGKTSFGLKNILLEELQSSHEGVLLVSYTNRAIDEICSKLLEEGIDFLRISSPSACSAAYQSYLLSERVKQCDTLQHVKTMLCETRVVVGTTTSLTNALSLFELRSFGLALIDEASQILEPHLLGLLCACHKGREAIKRFVMIGDHKQLPAVVQQDVADSVVEEDILSSAALHNCRESLFQRLLRLHGDERLVFQFTHQGRMHPDVALFANETFYDGTLLPIPLPHQERKQYFKIIDETDSLQKKLSKGRVVFLEAEQPSERVLPKANRVEAEMIAQVAKTLYDLYQQNGIDFKADEAVGIIVPYRHQIALVKNFLMAYDIPQFNELTIDTVERFQGSQRDVIIFGFTVQLPYQLDFLCAQTFSENGIEIDRKLNVALTRAREQMVLIGNPAILQRNTLLAKLVRMYMD